MSNNPKVGGSKKKAKSKSKKSKKLKKGGFINELLKQANKLAVPLSLLAGRELLSKSKSIKKK